MKLKILFLTNNLDVTLPLYEWLKQAEGSDNVLLWSDSITEKHFSEGEPLCGIEFIVSYNYSYIIKHDIIALFAHRIINLHISMLPWNKGVSPNIWSFIEGTPSGVTIHEIDEGLDSGDIILQQEIVFDYKTETLKSAYTKSQALICKLFTENWHQLKIGRFSPKPQPQHGTKHIKKDSIHFDHIIDYNDTIEDFLHKYNVLLNQRP